jgi:nitrile hydratase beta subunit
MNGIHDMGGMQDMGPIRVEKDEPVFHAPWEGRAFALFMVVDETNRFVLELIPPAEYLRMSYYERWLTGTADAVRNAGLVTSAELESGKAVGGKIPGRELFTVAEVAGLIVPRKPAHDAISVQPRFRVGQKVEATNINPVGHTRLPRYVRGKRGAIERVHVAEPRWDTDAQGHAIDKKPQPVYCVRFTARDLWGPEASPRDSTYVDLWEAYLEPA